MTTKPSKLEAFAHLLGKLPDAKIAEMAGLGVGVVASARARKGIAAFAGEATADEAAPTSEPPATVEKVEPAPAPAAAPKAPKPLKASTIVAEVRAAVAASKADPAAPPAEIRLTRSIRLAARGGIDQFLPASIYRGERAKQIWLDERIPRDAIRVVRQ